MAAAAGRRRPRARRHRRAPLPRGRRRGAGEADDGWLDAGRGSRACSRPTASRSSRSGSPRRPTRRPPPRASSASRRRQDGRGGSAQDRDRRRRARPARPRTSVRAAAERIGCPVLVQPYPTAVPSCSPASCRIPCSGRSSPSGPGGTLAELIGDARFALAPLTDVDVEFALEGGKAGKLVAGWRGAPPADRAALARLLHRLSRLAVDHPEVAELDLNPVLAWPGRLRRRRRPGTVADGGADDLAEDLVTISDRELEAARRVLARGELPLGRADLPARQSAAPGAARAPSTSSRGSSAIGGRRPASTWSTRT